jgi:membrane-bound lytic murein transglycosylase D
MQTTSFWLSAVAITLGIGTCAYKNSNEIISAVGGLPQQVVSINLNKPFDFAGEPVPMTNEDARQRLDKELLTNAYWHSNTILCIKRANALFPIIEPILRENGIPEDLKYLPVAESSLTNAVSAAGAKGVWQFMKGVGEAYNLEINEEVDERFHLEKATKAACDFLKSYYRQFGNWTMAAAAYNMGGPSLAKDAQAQRTNNYYDMNLNQETARYVFRLVSMKEIMEHQQEYGFYLTDLYPPMTNVQLIKVDGAVPNWGDFAKQYGTTYRMLKVLNPWLLGTSLVNKNRKTYYVKLPK